MVMTTPMHVYEELAAQYGNVDANDSDAVNRFFETEIYELPEETRLAIIEMSFQSQK